jgi:anti-sigma regulatory factor (Ser/Thr protein kinase)
VITEACVPQHACKELTGDYRSVGDARKMVRDTLAEWEITGTPAEDIELLVSELVTNAVVHGGPPVTLALYRYGHIVRGEVRDHGAMVPLIPRQPDAEATRGRGLHIVDFNADKWGADPLPGGGKVVWFLVSVTP